MLAEQWLRDGKLDSSLQALQEEVRKAPSDSRLRVFLFQTLVVMGQWDRALRQLQVAATLDAQAVPMAQAYRELIGCEIFRAEVFGGKRSPSVLGDPPAWAAHLIEALRLEAQNEGAHADELRAEAFEQAEATPGQLNQQPFAWVADADGRLGPVLEVIVRGRYFWMPFSHIRALRVEAPRDLRDVVWLPCNLTMRDGHDTVCFVPARYPGSEASANDLIRLGRKTEWSEDAPGRYRGLGQKMLVTDADEVGLLDVRALDLQSAEPNHG